MEKRYTMKEFQTMFEEACTKAQEEIDKGLEDVAKEKGKPQEQMTALKMSTLLSNLMYASKLHDILFKDK